MTDEILQAYQEGVDCVLEGVVGTSQPQNPFQLDDPRHFHFADGYRHADIALREAKKVIRQTLIEEWTNGDDQARPV